MTCTKAQILYRMMKDVYHLLRSRTPCKSKGMWELVVRGGVSEDSGAEMIKEPYS